MDASIRRLCGCGREVRYSHGPIDSGVMSCNKRVVCMTYEEQELMINKLESENLMYKGALEKIVEVNGMDYEYRAWAKQVLDQNK